MLQQIELRLFKCFALLKLPLGPLTLLSGANASGKSSVIQALVLLYQTIRDHEWSTRLMLNGASIRGHHDAQRTADSTGEPANATGFAYGA